LLRDLDFERAVAPPGSGVSETRIVFADAFLQEDAMCV
jgi:hypothetical protein